MPDPVIVDLGRTMDVLGTTRTDAETTTPKPLDAATVRQIETAVDTYRTETLERVREWLDGRAPHVDAQEAAEVLAEPALKLAKAAEHFAKGSVYVAEAGAMLDIEVARDKLDNLRSWSSKAAWLSIGAGLPWIAKSKATGVIAKHLVNLEALGTVYGKQLGAKLERNLPSLRESTANMDYAGVVKDKLEKLNYQVTDQQAAALGQMAKDAAGDTVVVIERVIERLKSDRPMEVLALLKGLAEGGLALYSGLEGLFAKKSDGVRS